ncbi:uroporphyrinogen decarboxylase family protein [Aerococcaceae bacterium WGS1372]
MNKNDLIKQTIAGKKTSQIPFSFWTHLPEIDRQPQKIAQATYDIYKEYNLDFIKTMNNGMYAVEDYNTVVDFSEVAKGGVAKVVDTPIKSYDDWAKLPLLDIDQSAAIQRELDHLKQLLDLVNGEAPVIMTVFSPLTTADKLSQGKLADYLVEEAESGKDYIRQALAKIAQTTAKLSEKAIELGASGVYFASQMSSYEKVDEGVYRDYGVPYDLQVLEGARDGWFNTIHVHGNDIMFDLVKDYPVQVFNWHIWETLPELKEGMDYTGKTIMGGIARMDITNNKRNKLRHQIYRSIMETEGRQLILTPGCGIRHPYDEGTIRFIQKVKEETEALLK